MTQGVEFDPGKASANLRKQGVGFAEAASCFLDPNALAMEDHSEGEARWLLIGRSEVGRMLTIAYTLRGDIPRLISARKASARERASYAS